MNELYVTYNLRSTYHELGTYDFKLVLDPNHFKNGHGSSIEFISSNGDPLDYKFEVWGRKLNCSFRITEDTPDGVAQVRVRLIDSEGKEHVSRLTFWIIKP